MDKMYGPEADKIKNQITKKHEEKLLKKKGKAAGALVETPDQRQAQKKQ